MNLLKMIAKTLESELLLHYKPELINIAQRQSQKISQSVTVIKIR